MHVSREAEDKQKQQEFIAQKKNNSKSQPSLQEIGVRIGG